jgi:hypothetical protein
MVLIRDVTLKGKRPSIKELIQMKMKEVYIPGKGMILVEETEHITVDVNININMELSEKDEAAIKKMFDSK